MVVSHVHEALRQVKEIRRRVLRKQIFRGYSGKARIAGGSLALLAAAVLSSPWFPSSRDAHVVGWGAVCALAFALNFAALLRWHRRESGSYSSFEELRPVVDVVAPLLAGAVLTFSLLRVEQHDLLFGAWMCMFGLANVASRHSLPEPNFYLGWFYILCGAVCLLFAPPDFFLNPWPMALTFGAGEIVGGVLFLRTRSGEDDL